MDPKITAEVATRHQGVPQIPAPAMAKASLRNAQTRKAEIGEAIRRAYGGLGWNVDEAARRVGVKANQFSAWLTGRERPQFDLLFNVPELCEPLVLELGRMTGAEIETGLRFPRRRTA